MRILGLISFRQFELSTLVIAFVLAANVSPVVGSVWKRWHRYAVLGWPVVATGYTGNEKAPGYPLTEYRLVEYSTEAWMLNVQIGIALLAVALLATAADNDPTTKSVVRRTVIILSISGTVVALMHWQPLMNLWLVGGILAMLIPAYRRLSPSRLANNGRQQFSLRDGLLLTIALAAAIGWLIRTLPHSQASHVSLEWIDRTTAFACAMLLAFRAQLAFRNRHRLAGAVLSLGCGLFLLANTWMLPAEHEHLWWGRDPSYLTAFHRLAVMLMFPFGMIYAALCVSDMTAALPPTAEPTAVPQSALQFWWQIALAAASLVSCVISSWLDIPRPLVALQLLAAYVVWVRTAWPKWFGAH